MKEELQMTKKNKGAKGSTGLTNKQGKDKASKQAIVASQFSTETATAGLVKSMAKSKTDNTSQPNNPNAWERKKNVKTDGHGRMRGQKNLTRIKNEEGKVVEIRNQHGVTFSVAEEKELKSLVDSFYRKRANLANSELGLLVGYDHNGQLTGTKDRIMLKEYSKGLQQFRTKEAYDAYKAEIKEFTSRSYFTDLTNDYKNRLLKTIASTTNLTDEEFKVVKKQISKMSQKEFAMRFGLGIFGTITAFYERYDKTGKRTKKLEDMTKDELEAYEARQAELEASGGGAAVNADDLYKRLGIGEDSIKVDTKNNRYTEYRDQQKLKRERERQKREAKAQEYEAKYQEFLTKFNQEDNEQTRAMFKHLRS